MTIHLSYKEFLKKFINHKKVDEGNLKDRLLNAIDLIQGCTKYFYNYD